MIWSPPRRRVKQHQHAPTPTHRRGRIWCSSSMTSGVASRQPNRRAARKGKHWQMSRSRRPWIRPHTALRGSRTAPSPPSSYQGPGVRYIRLDGPSLRGATVRVARGLRPRTFGMAVSLRIRSDQPRMASAVEGVEAEETYRLSSYAFDGDTCKRMPRTASSACVTE